jgi:hypothetical protein
MMGARSHRVDIIAVNWAVYSFVMILLFVIALAFSKISFPKGLVLTGVVAIAVHILAILVISKSIRSATTSPLADGGGVKLLEYTISFVCWMLYAVMWWYHTLDATCVFLFIPTYFATSLATYHVCFNYFARLQINKKTIVVLAINLWTLTHYILIYLRILKNEVPPVQIPV